MKGDRAKLKVKVRLNLHGIVSVESATVCISFLLMCPSITFTVVHNADNQHFLFGLSFWKTKTWKFQLQ